MKRPGRPFDPQPSTGAVALVTGAAQGIGFTTSLGLAKAGADVVGLDVVGGSLDCLGSEIRAMGRRFLAVEGDVADATTIRDVVADADDWRGRVDILVNNAAAVGQTLPPNVTTDDWDALFAVNVRGPFFLCQEIAKRMFARSGGVIVNVASVAGEVAASPQVAYEITKASLLQLTRSLAHVWAPTIRVNSVSPSFVPTELNKSFVGDPDIQRWVRAQTPLGDFGTREDVAAAIVFLASPLASHVTGHNLRVDGGWTIR